jgi:hypothetical protein
MVLLRGAISELDRSRRSHDFVLTEVQHQQVGVTAIAVWLEMPMKKLTGWSSNSTANM